MKKLIVLLIVTLTMVGCAGTTKLKTETAADQKVPDWYVEHEDIGKEGWIPFFRTDYVYAVGSSYSTGHDEAVLKATLKAKTRLADKVVGQLSHNSTMQYTETGSIDAPVGNATLNSITVNKIQDSVLRYYEVDEKMTFRNTTGGNFHSYILLKITKENLDKIALSL